jgi:5-dehydro-2-deoxygluconokinase
MNLTHSQVSDTRVSGDTQAAISTMLHLIAQSGPRLLIQKRGGESSLIHTIADGVRVEPLEVPGFPVEVKNILGAGDAFASGILYGFVNDWDWYKTVRLANACGAILVTQHGCANFMPTHDEVMAFIQEHGGF